MNSQPRASRRSDVGARLFAYAPDCLLVNAGSIISVYLTRPRAAARKLLGNRDMHVSSLASILARRLTRAGPPDARGKGTPCLGEAHSAAPYEKAVSATLF